MAGVSRSLSLRTSAWQIRRSFFKARARVWPWAARSAESGTMRSRKAWARAFEAVQRAREILDAPELQPARSFRAEVERFLKHKYETNRYSKMSADSKRSCLNLFADSVKNIPPTNVTGYQCKAFYNAAKARIAASTAESYMFTLRSFFNWCAKENLCRRNPVLDVQLDRIDRKGRTRFADFDLAQRLIEDALTDDLRYVLFAGFHVGMRKLEIVEAVPEWFNLSARTVEIRASKGIDIYRIATWLGDDVRVVQPTLCKTPAR